MNVNGRPAREYRPKVLEPDLHLMLEELHRSGDRKMLSMARARASRSYHQTRTLPRHLEIIREAWLG